MNRLDEFILGAIILWWVLVFFNAQIYDVIKVLWGLTVTVKALLIIAIIAILNEVVKDKEVKK